MTLGRSHWFVLCIYCVLFRVCGDAGTGTGAGQKFWGAVVLVITRPVSRPHSANSCPQASCVLVYLGLELLQAHPTGRGHCAIGRSAVGVSASEISAVHR